MLLLIAAACDVASDRRRQGPAQRGIFCKKHVGELLGQPSPQMPPPAAAVALTLLALLSLATSEDSNKCALEQAPDGSFQVPMSCMAPGFGNSSDASDGSTRVQEVKGEVGNGTTYVYNGDVRVSDAKRHGNGTCTFSTGDSYVGEWKDGVMSGTGKYTYANGQVYQGQFLNDEMNGFGKYTWPNGDGFNVYEGEWKDNQQNGRGKFTWPDGQVYEGDFKNGTSNGSGTMRFADGSTYEGNFKDGQYAGFFLSRVLFCVTDFAASTAAAK